MDQQQNTLYNFLAYKIKCDLCKDELQEPIVDLEDFRRLLGFKYRVPKELKVTVIKEMIVYGFIERVNQNKIKILV